MSIRERIDPDLYASFTWDTVSIAEQIAFHYFNFFTRRDHSLLASYPEELLKVVICLTGQAANRSSERAYTYQAGRIYVYKTLTTSSESALAGNRHFELIHLHFPIHKLRALADDTAFGELLLVRNKVLDIPLTPTVHHLISSLLESRYEGSLRTLQVESTLYQILFDVLATLDRQYLVALPTLPWADKIRVVKALLDQTAEFMTIASLAKQVGMNTTDLKSGFRNSYQTTIFAYQQEKKLQKAYELLLNGSLTVQEAAETCGYASLGSFSNTFLKRFGIRPSKLVKRPNE
jgi:AraC-like DNA-binding protein